MKFVCIVCPNSCTVEAQQTPDGIRVTGNACPRGESFARQELTCPMRTLTTTVHTAFAEFPVLPVKTAQEVKKNDIPEIMKQIARVRVEKKLKCGETAAVLPDGTTLVATADSY